ncbi:hypothetical protein K443DRAFT_422091 [Laccaria amethystina LaAM-08-1]|uniref:Uncharacterized protein n=1 Tax=Laccaria amethystina LaAM-08-1 TaxID=1095629 RepID=A0A0C9X549_9AGAR|nr:hypothetical protein K443DRAFT_422091 [Laccaria amethystina LaAM-08-1]
MCGTTPRLLCIFKSSCALRLRFAIGGRHSCRIHISNGACGLVSRSLAGAHRTHSCHIRFAMYFQSKIAYIFSGNHTAMLDPCMWIVTARRSPEKMESMQCSVTRHNAQQRPRPNLSSNFNIHATPYLRLPCGAHS